MRLLPQKRQAFSGTPRKIYLGCSQPCIAEGAHKVGASTGSLKMLAFLGRKQRTSIKTGKIRRIFHESEAPSYIGLPSLARRIFLVVVITKGVSRMITVVTCL